MLRLLSVLLLAALLSSKVAAADTYGAGTLTIPMVKVDGTLYQNVTITVGDILSIGEGPVDYKGPIGDTFDTYSRSNGQLRIPLVRVGSLYYYNVLITVGTILSVGPECLIDTTCSKVGTPEIKGQIPGDARISVMFNFMGGKITGLLSNTKFVQATSYTAICTSINGGVTGTSQTSVEYQAGLANLTNPLVVSGLTNGKAYDCSVVAEAAGAYPATSKSSFTAGLGYGLPNAGSVNAAGSLSGTTNTAHNQAYASYAAYCNYTNQSATGLPLPPTVAFYSTSGTLTSGTSESTLSCTNSERTITGNAIPDHRSSEFFTSGLTGYTQSPYFSGNPNRIASKAVSKTVPLSGTMSSLYVKGVNGFDTDACYTFTSASEPSMNANTKWTTGAKIWTSGAPRCTWVAYFAYMNNSVKVEVGTAETYTSSGMSYKVAGKNIYQDVGLDPSNAHNQPTGQNFYGSYHVHGMPEGHIARLGKGNSTMSLIGFAVDGFPIYARYGYTNPNSTSGGVAVMKSNYRLRTVAELSAAGYSSRPSASLAPYGSFEQDWVFDATSTASSKGNLDACNGRYGVTPESPTTAVYHYFITDGYPYVPRCVFGTPAAWANDGTAN
jgi:hypothetical protein